MNSFFYKKFANTKNNRIFAPNLSDESDKSSVYRGGVFLSPYILKQHRLLNRTVSRCQALLSLSKYRFNSLFFNTFLISQMRATVKNAIEVKNSNLKSTLRGAKSADFQELFLSHIGNSYPCILRLKFKQKRNHSYVVRGAFGKRRLFSWDKKMETAAYGFLREIKRKVTETPLFPDRQYSSMDLLV